MANRASAILYGFLTKKMISDDFISCYMEKQLDLRLYSQSLLFKPIAEVGSNYHFKGAFGNLINRFLGRPHWLHELPQQPV